MLAMGIEVVKDGKYFFQKDDLKIKYNITRDPEFRFKAAKKLYENGTRPVTFLKDAIIKLCKK
jgi:hypothetical protein